MKLDLVCIAFLTTASFVFGATWLNIPIWVLVYLGFSLANPILMLLSNKYIYGKIAPHSNGGGWDSGTTYSYHPRLKREESEAAWFDSLNTREKSTYLVFIALCGPVYALFWLFYVLLICGLPMFSYWLRPERTHWCFNKKERCHADQKSNKDEA